jgi:hypothetical protein
MRHYRQKESRRKNSVGEGVGKNITDELWIIYRWNIVVGKTVKSCSDATIIDGVIDGTNRWYIPKSWKRITKNITAIVNAPKKLQMVLCRWYVIIIEGYTDGIKRVNYFWHALCVCKFIGIFIIDGLTNNP